MEKQQKFNTICRNITEQNFCQFGNNCRYLHPGDVTTKVFIEKVDKKSKSKSKNSGKNVSENNQKQSVLKSPSSQLPAENFSKSECIKNCSAQPSMVDSKKKNTSAITYKLNSMNDGESLNDALKNEKGWRNKIKSQAKKITFEVIPEYAQTVINPGSSNATQQKQDCIVQNSEQVLKKEYEKNQIEQVQVIEKNQNNQKNQALDGEAKLRQVNYKKQLERQLEGQFISIENINQDLTLVTRDKQVILYDQLIPQIEEDIELTDKFQIHSIIKLTHSDDVIKLFYDPQSCQLYILQLNQSQKKMKFYMIEEVYQYLTHYSKDFNLLFIVVVNIDKENIGFFPLPEKRECQYLEPIVVKNYNETIINFQKTEQTLNINLQKGVIIEEFQLISQEIYQEVRTQNGQFKECQENSQDMIILEQAIPQKQVKQNKKKMVLSDSESENENDLEMSRYFQNKSSQNLLKYLSQNSTIQQDADNKNNLLNQSSILIDVGNIKEKNSQDSVKKVNSLQSTETSDIFSSPQTVSPKSENTQESLPKSAIITDKQQLAQKDQHLKNCKPLMADRNNFNQNNLKNKSKMERSKTQPQSKKPSNENKLQRSDEIKLSNLEQINKNKESQNKNQKCQKNSKKQSQSLNRSKEVSNSVEKNKKNEKSNQINSKINEKNEEQNQIFEKKQKNKISMTIEEDDLFPDDNHLLQQVRELKNNNKETKQTINKNDEGKGQSEKKKIAQKNSQKNQQNSNKLSHTLSKINDNQSIQIDDSSKEIIQISISSSNSLILLENDNAKEEFKRQKQNYQKKSTSEADEEFDIQNNLFSDTWQNKKSQSKEIKKDKAFLKANSKTNKVISKIKQKINQCIAQSDFQIQDKKQQDQESCIQSDIDKLKNQEKHSQIVDHEIRKQKYQDQSAQTNQVKYNQKNKEGLNTDEQKSQLKQVQKNYQEGSGQEHDEFSKDSKKNESSLKACNKLVLQQNYANNQPCMYLNKALEVNSKLEQTKNAVQNEQQPQNNSSNIESSGKSNNLTGDVITIRSDIILNKKKLQLVKYLKKEDIAENIKKMQIRSIETKQNNLSESNFDENQVQKSSVTINQNNLEKKNNIIIIHKSNYSRQKNYEIKSESYPTKYQPIKSKIDEPAAMLDHSEMKQSNKRKKIINMNKIKREELNNDYYDNLNSNSTYKYVKRSFEEPKKTDMNASCYQILSEDDFNNSNQRYKQNPPVNVSSMACNNKDINTSDEEQYNEDDIEKTILNEGSRRIYNVQYDQQDKKNISINQIPKFINQPQTYLQPNQQFNFQNQQVQSMHFYQPLQTNVSQNFGQNQIQYLSHMQQNPALIPFNFYSQCRGQNSLDFGFYNQNSFYQPTLLYNQQTQITDLELAQIELQKYQYIQQLIN